jgi:hypothetical protein
MTSCIFLARSHVGEPMIDWEMKAVMGGKKDEGGMKAK